MEPLFKFVVVRPPVTPDPRYPPILLAQESTFQINLARDATTADPRTAMDNRATAYLASTDFAGPAMDDKTNIKLAAAASALDSVAPGNIDNTKAEQVLKGALGGESTSAFLAEGGIDALELRIKDTMVALRQLSVEEMTGHQGTLALRIRTIETVRKVSTDKSFPFDSDDLSKWRLRPILAPTLADLNTILSDAVARAKVRQDLLNKMSQQRAIITGLFKERQALLNAHDAIANLPSSHQFTKPPMALQAIQPISELTPATLAHQHLTLLSQFSNLAIRHLELGLPSQTTDTPHGPINTGPTNIPVDIHTQGVSPPPAGNAPPPVNLEMASRPVSNEPLTDSAAASLADLSKTLFDQIKAVNPQNGAPAFTPPLETEVHFALKSTALEILPSSVQETLKSKNLDITSQPVDSTTNELQRHLAVNAAALDAQYQDTQPQLSKVRRVGNTMVKYQNSAISGWAAAFAQGGLDAISPDAPIGKPSGMITKLLQADLLVVKQQLKGYQKGDIAYIHNVLKSETNTRDTALTHSTTDTTTVETETTTDKQSDITTSDRFEMSRKSQNTIKEAESLKAGATMSASYGPAVSVSASANAAMDRSQEESGKSASKFSKDVTNKASDRIQKRVLQRETVATTVKSSEKEHHAFDNKGGKGHISGVYQWLNKVYEAQTWCYGKRTILDIMIPEPGAFLLDRVANIKNTKSDDIVLVPPFQATAKAITPESYPGYAETYGVTDINPPPRAYSRKAAVCALSVGQPHIYSQIISIDAGFYVSGIIGQVNGTPDPQLMNSQTAMITVQCGKGFHWVWRPNDNPQSPQTMSRKGGKEENEVAFSVTAQSMSQIGVNIELLLKRTDEAYSNWQNQTWAKLRAAHDKLVEAQNAAIAQAAFDASLTPAGANPAANLEVMNGEIKKSCIEIITDQHFEKFGAISTVSVGKDPKVLMDEVDTDRARVEGPYVRFFEEAFEWEEMTWITYPYFWGRKDRWYAKIDYQDPDPLFEKFMKAGYARANVPVRPGFEGALDHFLATGKPWDGGPLPGITSKLFLPLAAEIQESLGKSADKPTPYPGGPWDVVVPTNLVKLRKDDETPVWVKKGGNWEEVDDKAPVDP